MENRDSLNHTGVLTEEGAPAGIIEFLSGMDVPTVANAIELFKLRPRIEGFAPLTTRCLFPELGPMCGYAVTVHAETSTASNEKTEGAFIELFEAVEKSPKPAVVVFQETGPHPDFAVHSGEIMATIFKRLGAVGLISDCAVRDINEVRVLGFHYFARGSAASHANFRIVRVGVPVHIHGLLVKPGDLLHGDSNGLITVPRETFASLPDKVAEVRRKESRLLDFVRSAEFTVAGLKNRFLE